MKTVLPCAIYTRKSSEEGLEQGFNSLDAQREACEAFILSQKEQGWKALPSLYDDGGFSGGNTERPALARLLEDIRARRVRIVIVYKVDRLTRSLADFAKLVELFDTHGVSFVSVTQQFNTTSSMGRLTLNVLLSFAQFEREVTGERIRDKIAASKRKGMWMGGYVPIGYLPKERTLVTDEPQAERIREIYRLYLDFGCVRRLKAELDRLGWVTPVRNSLRANMSGGKPFSRGHLYLILGNPIYVGRIAHKEAVFPGLHPAIIDEALWQAVQSRLAANLQGHRGRSNVKNPCLLMGLAFDGQGRGLAPTHTKKGARRYRYYVGPALPGSNDDSASPSLRLPAQELEDAVLHSLTSLLTDKSRVVELMGAVPAREAQSRLRSAVDQAKRLTEAKSADRIGELKRLVSRVVVLEDRLQIAVRQGAIGTASDAPFSDEATILIEMPVERRRCGKAVRLIVRTAGELETRGQDAKLIALLAKAHEWFAQLTSGRYDSVYAIAQEQGLTRAYVTKVIHLAFLAPDIVERIARGNHPLDLSAHRLIRMGSLPLAWEEQRALLGMTG